MPEKPEDPTLDDALRDARVAQTALELAEALMKIRQGMPDLNRDQRKKVRRQLFAFVRQVLP